MTSALVVEDQLEIARLVKEYLNDAGIKTIAAADAAAAMAAFRTSRPDLVVLDLGLPGSDGLDVLRAIRARHATPVVILTARADETDIVVGLELGADDYITKPFSPRELVARIRAVMRRVDAPQRDLLDAGPLRIDQSRLEATVDGDLVDLTVSEFRILVELARRPGHVRTRSQLLEVIHGTSIDSYQRAIDAHIKNLRRKIDRPGNDSLIETAHGVGYRLRDIGRTSHA